VLPLILVGVGIWRGKVRGISEELLDFLQWLVIVAAAGFLYGFVGDLLVQARLSRLAANMTGYVLIVVVITIIFGFIQRAVGSKLVDSDFFGSWEYRLGMLAGGLRFLCIWIVVLALLSARFFDPAMVAAERKAQEKEVGLVLLPTWGILYHMAFHTSLSGPYIREYLSHQLITPVGYVKPSSDNSIGKQQQRVLDEMTASPKQAPASPPEKK
jgi:uncharacterized membrane protein required for colicin V production